jgi:hypothetical protein
MSNRVSRRFLRDYGAAKSTLWVRRDPNDKLAASYPTIIELIPIREFEFGLIVDRTFLAHGSMILFVKSSQNVQQDVSMLLDHELNLDSTIARRPQNLRSKNANCVLLEK